MQPSRNFSIPEAGNPNLFGNWDAKRLAFQNGSRRHYVVREEDGVERPPVFSQ